MNEPVARAEAQPYVRRVRRTRIALLAMVAVGAAILLALMILIGRTIVGGWSWVAAVAVAVIGSLLLQSQYVRLSLANETSFVSLLTEDLDPELFSCVLRQTQAGRRDFPYMRTMMHLTERFYLGDDEAIVTQVPKDRSIFNVTQPEFVSYCVQSACNLGQTELAGAGLALLRQSVQNPTTPFSSHPEIYLDLALAACALADGKPEQAEECARRVYENASVSPLLALYACAYLALALEAQGFHDKARPYREEALRASPAFGILRRLR